MYVDAPTLIGRSPIVQLRRLEPQANFKLCCFSSIRAVDHIAADVHSEVATDGAWLSLQRLGRTDQLAGAGNHAIAFPNHGHHRTGGDELNKTSKERTLLMHAVVLLSQLTAGSDLLQANQLETLALEATQDLAHQPALDTIRLDGDECAFGGHE